MSVQIEIDGKLIKLRDWQLKDVLTFFRWNNAHYPWMDTNGPYFGNKYLKDISECRRIKERIEKKDFSDPRNNLVIADAGTDEMIGSCTWYWQIESTEWLSVGIVIYDDAQWGKGIGYEALGLYCQYLLDANTTLRRLDMRTFSGNKGMIAVAHKLGFNEEARFRNAVHHKGIVYDNLGFGVLREEWNVLYPKGFAHHL